MGHLVGLGEYRDKTLEWLFFHDPGYVWRMIYKGVDKRMSEPARVRFKRLVRRAKNLAIPGTCRHCSQPVSRMCLGQLPSGRVAAVHFFCNDCSHPNARCEFANPGFYTPGAMRHDKLGGKILVNAIKQAYFGSKTRMTQARMEEFFNTPKHFSLKKTIPMPYTD